MLVIMNPPYGKCNSIVKLIMRRLIDKLDFESISLLCPIFTFRDPEILSHVEKCERVPNIFTDAAIFDLCVSALNKEKVNKYNIETLTLKTKELTLVKAVKEYNKIHESSWLDVDGNRFGNKWNLPLNKCSKSKWSSVLDPVANKEFHECVEDFTVFFEASWTPLDGVHANESHDRVYNLRNERWPARMVGKSGNAFVFRDRQSRENFVKWWYSYLEKTNGKKERVGLTNALLTIIAKAVSGDAGSSYFRIYFPNVDWSKSWTDEEILEEIGLPKDFLEKRREDNE